MVKPGNIPWNKGKKGLQKAWNKGISRTKKEKENISKANKGKHFIGHPCSEETKKKIALSHLGKKRESSTHWKNGISLDKGTRRYGDDWDQIRYLVYKRDNFMCQKCFKTNIKLDVHHKIPFLVSFNNSMDNLISLCKSCHMKEEWIIEGNFINKIRRSLS